MRLFKSIYSKAALGLAGLFLLVGLMFIGITVFSTNMYQQEVNQKLNSNLAQQIVKERLLMTEGQVNNDALKEIFHMLMVINPGIEIYLLDPKGKILTFSAPEGTVKRQYVSLEPIKKWLNQDMLVPLQGDDPRDLKRKKVFSAAPIKRQGKLEGYMYVILGGEEYDSVVQKLKGSYILQLSAWMIVAGLLFALITGLLLFAMLTDRLKKLTKVMDAFKRGDSVENLEYPVNPTMKSEDEIDRLSAVFREMSLRIEAQMTELKESDEMRRELVANVSHDLRTPLTTLQGYIETLLIKEDRYTPQERREYLEIAISHCRRLSKLVKELLELANLESVRMQVDPEPFNLPELVQDIIQKFSLQLEGKQIELKTKTEESLPFAHADIALVERALENLIENAIHFTPANGCITIEILLEQDLLIKVSDTGPGIPVKDQEHIFERFYHVDQSRKDREGHSGLGLAITKRIIELHNKIISVESLPGEGTTFLFQLPVYRK